jgi:hypothetical protein
MHLSVEFKQVDACPHVGERQPLDLELAGSLGRADEELHSVPVAAKPRVVDLLEPRTGNQSPSRIASFKQRPKRLALVTTQVDRRLPTNQWFLGID